MCLKRILIAIFVVLNLTTEAQKDDSLFLVAAVAKMKNAKVYALEIAGLMPQNKYAFKPAPEERSFAGQLLHIANSVQWFCSTYLSGPGNPAEIPDSTLDKDTITKCLNRAYDYALLTLQNFNGSHLSDTVSFDAVPMNKLQIINLLNDHQTHHKGQLVVYLRLNGIKPPDYMGW
jgi:uncharacterized damage-inducible protein DinB